jgi:hypothetical protein
MLLPPPSNLILSWSSLTSRHEKATSSTRHVTSNAQSNSRYYSHGPLPTSLLNVKFVPFHGTTLSGPVSTMTLLQCCWGNKFLAGPPRCSVAPLGVQRCGCSQCSQSCLVDEVFLPTCNRFFHTALEFHLLLYLPIKLS